MNGKWEAKDIEKLSYIPNCKVNPFSEIVMAGMGYTIVRRKENTEYYSGPGMKLKGPEAILYKSLYHVFSPLANGCFISEYDEMAPADWACEP